MNSSQKMDIHNIRKVIENATETDFEGDNTYRLHYKKAQEIAELAYKVGMESVNVWKKISDEMPAYGAMVQLAVEFDSSDDWRIKIGCYMPDHPDAKNGWLIHGASWAPSHWMELPLAPNGKVAYRRPGERG